MKALNSIQDLLENFYPKYSSCDQIARLNDLEMFMNDELTDKELATRELDNTSYRVVFNEYLQLQNNLVVQAVENYKALACDIQKEICIDAFENSFGDKNAVEKISSAARPDYEAILMEVQGVSKAQQKTEHLGYSKSVIEGFVLDFILDETTTKVDEIYPVVLKRFPELDKVNADTVKNDIWSTMYTYYKEQIEEGM
jgi:hypothetical protein